MDKTLKRKIGYVPPKKSLIKEVKPVATVKQKNVPAAQKKKSKKGGARPGAGRPAGIDTKLVGFRIPTEHLEEIKAKIRKLIDIYKK